MLTDSLTNPGTVERSADKVASTSHWHGIHIFSYQKGTSHSFFIDHSLSFYLGLPLPYVLLETFAYPFRSRDILSNFQRGGEQCIDAFILTQSSDSNVSSSLKTTVSSASRLEAMMSKAATWTG